MSKPTERPAEQRRFQPKVGELQKSGTLERKFVLDFTAKCIETLMSDESLKMLGECGSMNEMGMLSVSWQRCAGRSAPLHSDSQWLCRSAYASGITRTPHTP